MSDLSTPDDPAAENGAGGGDETAGMLTEEQARVLGSLIEKSRTTPDDYPLTANALMRACNQSTSRDPVVNYDQRQVERVVAELKAMGLVRFVHMATGRAVTKYRHVVDEAWGLDPQETAIVGLLLLRGAQTAPELKLRSERYGGIESLEQVATTLQRLADRPEGWVVRLDRQVGQREDRWTHTFHGTPLISAGEGGDRPGGGAGAARGAASQLATEQAARIEALESEVARLAALLAEVRSELGLDSAEG